MKLVANKNNFNNGEDTRPLPYKIGHHSTNTLLSSGSLSDLYIPRPDDLHPAILASAVRRQDYDGPMTGPRTFP